MVNESTETNLKDEQEEFEYVLEILRQQLRDASNHFYIFKQLWPTENVVGIIKRYKGFFQPTRAAHVDRLIIKVSDIVSNASDTPNYYRIFKLIGRNPNLAPDINVHELKQRIRIHKKTLKAIKDYRNKRAAHWITTVEDDDVDKPLLLDTEQMLQELEAIFNKIGASHSGRHWEFLYLQHRDTIGLLNVLKERIEKEMQDRKLRKLKTKNL